MSECEERHVLKRAGCGNLSNPIYGFAFIGAAIYYLQHSSTFWEGVLGILKAAIWPAMLVYKLLDFLKM
jgi:hypothetical protein